MKISFSTTICSRSIRPPAKCRQLTATESAEYRPHCSPDGKTIVYEATKRGLTDLETTMEDTHVWMIDAEWKKSPRSRPRPRQPARRTQCSNDGRWIYFTAQERGEVHLYRIPAAGGKPEAVVKERGSVGSFSVHGDLLAYTMSTPSDQAELYLKSGDGAARQLTDVNHDALAGKTVEPVEAFTFISNDNKWTVEAFLTYPADFRADRKYPLIVNIHGGPHGQQGPAFNFKNQVYASHRLGHHHGQLSRIHRLRPGLHRCGLRRSERQRREGRSLRRQCRAAPLSVDRSRPARHRRHQLRRPVERVADHADPHVQSRDPHRRHHQHHQLQLHDVLQPVRGRWSGARFRIRAT